MDLEATMLSDISQTVKDYTAWSYSRVESQQQQQQQLPGKGQTGSYPRQRAEGSGRGERWSKGTDVKRSVGTRDIMPGMMASAALWPICKSLTVPASTQHQLSA